MHDLNDSHAVIDLDNLAYRTGTPRHEVREAAGKLFEQLSGQDPDLTKALVAASLASGLQPAKVLAIMTTLAEDLRRPVSNVVPMQLGERLTGAGTSAIAMVNEKTGQLRASAASIDIAEISQDGREKLREIRERVGDIDLAELGARAREAGTSLLEGAQSVVKIATGHGPKSPPKGKARKAD